MKSSIRVYRVTSIILMIVCTALLINSNYQKNRAAEIVDQYFDLQTEYEKIFDDVQELEKYSERLEEQVDKLSNELYDLENIDPTIEWAIWIK